MADVWTEDQADLLKYSLRNIFETVDTKYQSNKFYIATPFDRGYRQFDIEGVDLIEMIFKVTELLKSKNFDRLNIEKADGLPILTVHLEAGPSVVVTDVITEKAICNILL